MNSLHPVTVMTLMMLQTATYGNFWGPFRSRTIDGRQRGPIQGSQTVSTITCEYFEIGGAEGGPRGINITRCRNFQGRNLNVKCAYYGANPHNCGNRYNDNRLAYYKDLARSAMEDGALCTKSEIDERICDLTYRCSEGDCLQTGRSRIVCQSKHRH